jgi:hypothetical protein
MLASRQVMSATLTLVSKRMAAAQQIDAPPPGCGDDGRNMACLCLGSE